MSAWLKSLDPRTRVAELFIDDEADQSSFNTYAKKNASNPEWVEDDFSKTYESILNLKQALLLKLEMLLIKAFVENVGGINNEKIQCCYTRCYRRCRL